MSPVRVWSEADLQAELNGLHRYARMLTRDPEAARDLVQDTIVRAYSRRGQFQPERSLRSWLFAILHNIFISGVRSGDAAARRDRKLGLHAPGAVPATQEDSAYLNQVAERFAALPPEQRAVLHLVAVEELSYQEAAEVLGAPVGTVMSRLSRARAALRSIAAEPQEVAPLRLVGGHDDGR